MKKKTLTVVCIILAAAMFLGIVGPIAVGSIYSMVASAASSSDLNDKLNKNKQNQNELKQQLEETQREKKEMQEKKEQLDNDISTIAGKIDSINKTIAKNESDIAQKQKEIAELESNIDESDKLLRKRLRVMCERGSMSYAEILFSATSFSDLLVRIDMVKQLYSHDQELISQLTKSKKSIEAAKKVVEEAKAANVSLKSELSSQKSAMQEKSDESEAVIGKLAQSEQEIKAQIAEKEKENQSILNAIAAAKNSGVKAAANTYKGGTLGWPSTNSGTITSRFGWRTFRGVPNNHTGIDIAVPLGTPVLACEDGVVTGSGWRNAYGNCITIDHGSITTLYAHNSVLQVSVGQQVKRGQQIALAGSTGNSTGPHIHLGIIKNGHYLDPAPYIGL